MIEMDKYELTVEYSTKGTDKVNEKSIDIDLQEYENSYKSEVYYLQEQYTKSEVNRHIRPTKEQFIFESISKNLGDNEELVSFIDPLVDEVDEYIIGSNK
jgi:hypothetical protein